MKEKSIKILFFALLLIFNFNSYAQVQRESFQSLFIERLNGRSLIGCASGFIIKSKTKYYLITNWHVVTNKNSNTLDWLDSTNKIVPDNINIFHNDKVLGKYNVKNQKILDTNGNLFIQFPLYKGFVDIVAIPIDDTVDLTLLPVNYVKTYEDLVISPTEKVFVIGFPKGKRINSFNPIWKSGYLASEPDLNLHDLPLIAIDMIGFKGMSGSPVYFIESNYTSKTTGFNMEIGKQTFFMGVFSNIDEEIQLGYLWKSTFLKKLFDSLP